MRCDRFAAEAKSLIYKSEKSSQQPVLHSDERNAEDFEAEVRKAIAEKEAKLNKEI